ncbi:RNA-directed DNA polymerase, eukaryota [Tanacetum coccineum]
MFSFMDGLNSMLENALIKIRTDAELKDTIVLVMPKLVGEGFYTCTIRVEYELEPPKCACCKTNANTSGNKKTSVETTKEDDHDSEDEVESIANEMASFLASKKFLEFLASMEGVDLVDMRDRWVWSLEGSGEFSVASVRRPVDERWLPEVSTKTLWINVVPIKVNVWKVKLDCLPARLNISRRGMNIDSILCPICDKAVESTSHIFFVCHIARDVFHKITSS